MWDSSNSSMSNIRLIGILILTCFFIIISFFNSLYNSYRNNVINESNNTKITEIQFKNYYKLYSYNKKQSNVIKSERPSETIKNEKHFNIYNKLKDKEFIEIKNQRYQLFSNNNEDLFFLTANLHSNKFYSDYEEKRTFMISSKFLIDSIHFCPTKKVNDDCLSVRQTLKINKNKP